MNCLCSTCKLTLIPGGWSANRKLGDQGRSLFSTHRLRNKDGETSIFTTVDNDAIPPFIEHGADLTTTRARR